MSGACSTHEVDEKCLQNFSVKPRKEYTALKTVAADVAG